MMSENRHLNRPSRISSSLDFEKVKRRGTRVDGVLLCLAWAARQRRRLGIVVSARVGNAVVRNRIKRVIRETFRCNRNNFPLGDVVVIAKGPAAKAENKKIRDALISLAERASKKEK